MLYQNFPRIHRISATACLLGLLTLTGCGTPAASAPELGRCILDNASAQWLTAAGAQAANPAVSPPALSRWSGGSCAGTMAMASDSAYRQAVSVAFRQQAAARLEYRSGQYAGVAGLPVNEQAKDRVVSLGVLLEQVLHTRRDTIACGLADPEAVAMVGQLDGTFTLAAMGRYVGVDEFSTAKAAASVLLELAGANARTAPVEACGPTLEGAFKGHVTQWSQFYTGEHPWAPGCTVTSDEQSFVLKCA